MNIEFKQSILFIYLTESKHDESEYTTPEQKLCRSIRAYILQEENRPFLFQNIALAMNMISNTLVEESNSEKLYQKFLRLTSFVAENGLRFPLEETIIEDAISLQEDDGGAPAAPAGDAPTNNTSGVAKLDYPLGESPKRKKELTEELQLETPEWKDAIGNEKKALFKVHSNGKLAAQATIYRLPDGSHEVSDIKTEDEFRRKGVATKLVDHIFTSTNAPFLRFLGGTTSDGTEFFGKYGETKLDGKRVVARPSRLGHVKDASDSTNS